MIFIPVGIVFLTILFFTYRALLKWEEPLERFKFERTNASGVIEFLSWEEKEEYQRKRKMIQIVAKGLYFPSLVLMILGVLFTVFPIIGLFIGK